MTAVPIIALALFSIGVYGVLTRHDLLRILISVSIILGSITLLLASVGTASSYSFVLFAWIVEVVEILVALAIFIYRSDVNDLRELKW